jgi:hypothetical protein
MARNSWCAAAISVGISYSWVVTSLFAAEGTAQAKAATTPRQIAVASWVASSPLFVTRTATLDPRDLARESWKGWISKRGIPWGLTTDFTMFQRPQYESEQLP